MDNDKILDSINEHYENGKKDLDKARGHFAKAKEGFARVRAILSGNTEEDDTVERRR